MGARFGRGWVFGATLSCAAAAILMLASAAAAATPVQVIISTGPLTNVWIGADLSCQVAHTGDASYELYGGDEFPADCGTFVATGGTLYAPDFANHAYTFTRALGVYTPFTAVSQSAVLGSGTSTDPYRIVTVADVGTTGLRLTQTDSYVVGQEAYRTDVQIANSGGTAQSVTLYRAGDCELQGLDSGYGAVGSPAGAVACVAPSPSSRIEQWVPLTSGSHYLETSPASVWSAIAGRSAFADTCDCTTNEDNGAGLSWTLAIPAGGSKTVSNLTNFSPAGNRPLSTAKTADRSSVSAGGQDGYTITLANPNASGVQVASISDTLPAGFTYAPGSTTGVTTSNPTISGQTLTWTGPYTDPSAGSISLHFDVTAPSTPGTYFNNATADAGGLSVVPTGDTAPVTVTAATTHTLTVSKEGTGSGSVTSSPAGIDCGATCSTPFTAGSMVTLTATAAAGSSFTGWSGGGCSGTGTCTVTLNADTTVTATFAPITHTLTVSKPGKGSGGVTSSPAGIDCGATCSNAFDEGSMVTLTATATAGSTFTGWTGGGCSGTGTCAVTLDADTTVTATFTPLTVYHTLTVAKAGGGSGTVSSSPAGIDCGGTCSTAYVSGATITLTATAYTGSTFAGWSGGGCSGTGTCTVTLDADTTVTATFTAQATGARTQSGGWWKNHAAETSALLPLKLGNYTVGSLDAASAVFGANNCGRSSEDGVGCLAAELLVAKLNVNSGTNACIAPTIAAADAFLIAVGYSGPGSYTLSDAQRSQALSLKNDLQHYDGSGNC